ncbi:MAG: hypothetical protein QXS74_08280 [Nitrososphaeria archaeon]
MRLFNSDANFDLTLKVILSLANFSEILPKTYVEAVDRLRSEKERIAAKYQELIDTLKEHGFSGEEIEEIIKECELNIILKAMLVKISEETAPKILEEIKFKSKTIKLVSKDISLFEELLKTKKDLQKCEDMLREAERFRKTREAERVFNEIANLEICARRYPGNIEGIRKLAELLCREINDHTLLPFIKMLGLEYLSILDAINALDFLVSKNLVDSENFLKSVSDIYLPWSDFTVFIFLLAHIQKILSYEEILEEIGLHRWKENWKNWKLIYRGQEKEPLLNLSKMLIIPLSLGKHTYARLALALATLVIDDWEYRDNPLFEDLCRSLMNLGKYGRDEWVEKLLTYSYFYGDIDAIIKVGKLTGDKKSMEKALNELKTLVE